MQKKSTLFVALFMAAMAPATTTVFAQSSCPNAKVLWAENFGSGTTATSDPNVVALTYQATGILENEGVYRIINSTQQKPEWHLSGDHTGNTEGKMLVANGQAETFYQKVITNTSGFSEGSFNASLYIMNVDVQPTCSPNPLLPIITFNVEYKNASGNWISFAGSPFTGAAIPQTVTPTWVYVGGSFTLPSLGNFAPTQLRLTISDGTVGGCGNDFAVDDISFSQCPEGGPTPVTFLDLNAYSKNNGVSIEWSTSQEINSKSFTVEKSRNGSTDWSEAGTINAAGNSQVVKQYSLFDAKPYSGINYYRIKQADQNGELRYSKVVMVKTSFVKTAISILSNPFQSVLKLSVTSDEVQEVTARIMDITGREVATEKWTTTAGDSRKDLNSTLRLQKGMYIISIQNNEGKNIFNGKVIKQ